MLAKSASQLQIVHMRHVFGVEIHKDANGVVLFLIWASIVAVCGSFAHKSLLVALFA